MALVRILHELAEKLARRTPPRLRSRAAVRWPRLSGDHWDPCCLADGPAAISGTWSCRMRRPRRAALSRSDKLVVSKSSKK
jgi:hypothetical protein